MRSILTTLTHRGSALRALQALVGVTAIFVLTGAKGEGCGGGGDTGAGGDGGGTTTDPGLVCDPGFHVETICDGMCDENNGCHDECVPDGPCPPGLEPNWICAEPDPQQVPPCPDDAQDCPPPPEPNCWVECVPPNPCGDGFHEETVCGGPVPMDDGQTSTGVGPQDCWTECVPDNPCGPGFHEEWVCDPSIPEDQPQPGDCYPTCVPDEPACPPGSHEEWVCEPGDPNDPNGGGGCYPICVPDEPACPPGSHEEWVCDDPGICSHDKCVEGPALDPMCDPAIALICQADPFCCEAQWDAICVAEVGSIAGEQCGDPDQYPPSPEPGCYPICVDDQPSDCPPGQHLEWVCGQQGDPNACQLACVDDVVPEPPPQE